MPKGTLGTGEARRDGTQTRRAAQRVALELFTSQGYEATSLRQIAEALGINKASLYYHFRSKDDILASLFEDRGSEAQDLLDWVRGQPRTPNLLAVGVRRWVGSFSADKLRGIRFLAANPLLAGRAGPAAGERFAALGTVADVLAEVLPDPTPRRRLQLRMAVLSINAAVAAASGTDLADDEILAAAHRVADVLVQDLLGGEGVPGDPMSRPLTRGRST